MCTKDPRSSTCTSSENGQMIVPELLRSVVPDVNLDKETRSKDTKADPFVAQNLYQQTSVVSEALSNVYRSDKAIGSNVVIVINSNSKPSDNAIKTNIHHQLLNLQEPPPSFGRMGGVDCIVHSASSHKSQKFDRKGVTMGVLCPEKRLCAPQEETDDSTKNTRLPSFPPSPESSVDNDTKSTISSSSSACWGRSISNSSRSNSIELSHHLARKRSVDEASLSADDETNIGHNLSSSRSTRQRALNSDITGNNCKLVKGVSVCENCNCGKGDNNCLVKVALSPERREEYLIQPSVTVTVFSGVGVDVRQSCNKLQQLNGLGGAFNARNRGCESDFQNEILSDSNCGFQRNGFTPKSTSAKESQSIPSSGHSSLPTCCRENGHHLCSKCGALLCPQHYQKCSCYDGCKPSVSTSNAKSSLSNPSLPSSSAQPTQCISSLSPCIESSKLRQYSNSSLLLKAKPSTYFTSALNRPEHVQSSNVIRTSAEEDFCEDHKVQQTHSNKGSLKPNSTFPSPDFRRNSQKAQRRRLSSHSQISSPNKKHRTPDTSSDLEINDTAVHSVRTNGSNSLNSSSNIISPLNNTLSSSAPTPSVEQVAPVIRCKWQGCDACHKIDPSDLLEHIRQHADEQISRKAYACLWEDCKVFNKPSWSASWLERHIVMHSGHRPFKCILDKCGQRFHSQAALERHVNSHFGSGQGCNGQSGGAGGSNHGSGAGLPGNAGHRKDEAGRLHRLALKRKRLMKRRYVQTVQKNDFFDDQTMAVIRQDLVSLAAVTGIDVGKRGAKSSDVTFQRKVIGCRTTQSGTKERLLEHKPRDILDDSWVLENVKNKDGEANPQASSSKVDDSTTSSGLTYQEKPFLKPVSYPLHKLPLDTVETLHPSLYRRHRFRKNKRK